jgi:transcriptional regulator with XRE-family HTH domain
MTETLGKRLAKTIKASGCTKGDIAMGAGISPSMMTAYLKDQELPAHAEAVRIAELLDTSASWLLHGKHPNAPKL